MGTVLLTHMQMMPITATENVTLRFSGYSRGSMKDSYQNIF